MAVECAIGEDDGRLLARLSGRWTGRPSTPSRCLLKCLAEEPDALIIDVAGLIVHDRLSLAVFTAVMRQAALLAGHAGAAVCAVPAARLTCCVRPRTAGCPIFPTVEGARREARNHRVRPADHQR